jgi:hypothetical protein
MTLKRHLTIVVTLLLAVTMAAFAWLLVRTTRSELMKQLGDAVVGAAARDAPFPRNQAAGREPAARAKQEDPSDTGVNGGRRVARLLYDATGKLLNFEPSGFADEPDPIVNLPTVGSAEQLRMVDRLIIRRSDDGSIRYLVMTRAVRNNRVRFDDRLDRGIATLGGFRYAVRRRGPTPRSWCGSQLFRASLGGV